MIRHNLVQMAWEQIVTTRNRNRRRFKTPSPTEAASRVVVSESLEDRRLLTTVMEPIRDINEIVDAANGNTYGSGIRDVTRVGNQLFFVANDQ